MKILGNNNWSRQMQDLYKLASDCFESERQLAIHKKALELMCDEICPEKEICPNREEGRQCNRCTITYYLEKAKEAMVE